MEFIAFGTFAVILMTGVIADVPLWISLLLGLVVFLSYGKLRGFSLRELLVMSCRSMLTAKNIAVVMLLIGALSALWRSCGTIAYIVSGSLNFIDPAFFLPAVFVLNTLMSVLTGTSFGTVATMGIISMSIGSTLGVEPVYTAGAVLSGAYFGDRCSPISTSAIFVAEVTKTKLYSNIAIMCKTGVAAFLLSLVLYFALSYFGGANVADSSGVVNDDSAGLVAAQQLFATHFNMSWALLLPAIGIIVLSVLRVDVKINMVVSIVLAGILNCVLQGVDFAETLHTSFFGFESADPVLSHMLNGGGMFGMIKLTVVVCVALCYAGIFRGTNMLSRVTSTLNHLAQKTTPFTSLLITSIVTNMLACNQTLSITLTSELCQGFVVNKNGETDKNKLAQFIENSCITIAPMVPWSIASIIPIGMLQTGTKPILFAFYLYLIPLTQLVADWIWGSVKPRYIHLDR